MRSSDRTRLRPRRHNSSMCFLGPVRIGTNSRRNYDHTSIPTDFYSHRRPHHIPFLIHQQKSFQSTSRSLFQTPSPSRETPDPTPALQPMPMMVEPPTKLRSLCKRISYFSPCLKQKVHAFLTRKRWVTPPSCSKL